MFIVRRPTPMPGRRAFGYSSATSWTPVTMISRMVHTAPNLAPLSLPAAARGGGGESKRDHSIEYRAAHGGYLPVVDATLGALLRQLCTGEPPRVMVVIDLLDGRSPPGWVVQGRDLSVVVGSSMAPGCLRAPAAAALSGSSPTSPAHGRKGRSGSRPRSRAPLDWRAPPRLPFPRASAHLRGVAPANEGLTAPKGGP